MLVRHTKTTLRSSFVRICYSGDISRIMRGDGFNAFVCNCVMFVGAMYMCLFLKIKVFEYNVKETNYNDIHINILLTANVM